MSTRIPLLRRTRLVDRLARCVRFRLTVVLAPAGFGKTTLLHQWRTATSGEHAIAWLPVEGAEGDPSRFMHAVAAGLEAAAPGAAARMLALLREVPDAAPAEILSRLTESLADPTRHCVLAMDDYHLVRSEVVHETVRWLLDRSPARVHLVIAARASPPLPLSRLRARGELLEIRAPDLRFTMEEATELLELSGAPRLPHGAAEALAARTEGWGAALRIAARSAEDRDEPGALLESFTGSHHLLADYLAEEVLQREPSQVRRFLLRTSILERLSGPLCEVLARTPRRRSPALHAARSAQRMLVQLERENLFLVPLDEERRWWRYHRLVGEFLRRRLEEDAPGEITDLHARAARWLEANGFAAEASAHAIEMGDPERAARLLEQAWRTGRIPARPSRALACLRRLPGAVMESRPALGLMEAWALAGTGQWAAAETRLREAARGRPRRRSAREEAGVLRGFAAALSGEAHRAVQLSRSALRRLPRSSPSARAFAHLSLGLAYESLEDDRAARDGYSRARAGAEPGVWGVAPLMAAFRLGSLELAGGSLREAARHFEEAAHLASWVGEGAPGAGMAEVGLGRVCYEWNDLEAATRRLHAAIELGTRSDLGDDVAVLAYVQLAHVRESQGDPRAARRLAERSDELARRRRSSSRFLLGRARALLLRLRVRQGDADGVMRWLETWGKDGSADRANGHDERAAWARALVSLGRGKETIDPIERWLRAARTSARAGCALELEVLRSMAHAALGNTDAALLSLDDALTHARREGWVRLFLDEGEPMARLLERAGRRRSATSADARGLLAASRDGEARAEPSPGTRTGPGEPLFEPLTDREREIVALVADGLSNPEIADQLLVRIATVKTHINHLFAKLGVRSRTGAVARARRLGLA